MAAIKIEAIPNVIEFEAEVEDFKVSHSSIEPITNAVLTVHKRDNEKLAIVAVNPTAEQMDFLKSLKIGVWYVFPTVYLQWHKEQLE